MPKPTVTGSAPTSDVGVLDKIMTLCACLDGTPKALPEVSAATGLHRATAHRLLTAMAVHGLARQDAQTQWSLGPRCLELGRRASLGVPLAEAAGPTLLKLRDLTGESTQLYVRDADSRVCVAATESLHGLRTIVSVGAVLPLDKGSAGKVLRGEPAAIRRGWAESVGEREAGVASVSAAIVDRSGLVRAAISVSGPIERTTKRPGPRWGDALRASAKEIQHICGWSD
jgi:DNA-binding IclR family transcriptional regulator